MKSRILVVLYNIGKAQEHEWFIEFMNHNLFEFHFALINGSGSPMDLFLQARNIPVYRLNYSGKKDLPAVTWRLYRMMRRNRYSIVHAHLFEGALTGITAAWLAGVPKRIVTRHYSDFHHVYNPSAVKYDRWINGRATHLVAVSNHVGEIIIKSEGTPANKVRVIWHGIDLSDYRDGAVGPERIRSLRVKHKLEGIHPVIGVISKCIEWKGLQYVIPAFSKVLSHYPQAVLLLANFKGPYKNKVREMLSAIPGERYRLVEFENDIAGLYTLFDCFVHIPVTRTIEAFGQVYLEALAARVPSVFTMSGIAPDIAVDGQNCLVVPYRDAPAVAEAIERLLGDSALRERLTKAGYDAVSSRFEVSLKYKKMEALYLE